MADIYGAAAILIYGAAAIEYNYGAAHLDLTAIRISGGDESIPLTLCPPYGAALLLFPVAFRVFPL